MTSGGLQVPKILGGWGGRLPLQPEARANPLLLIFSLWPPIAGSHREWICDKCIGRWENESWSFRTQEGRAGDQREPGAHGEGGARGSIPVAWLMDAWAHSRAPRAWIWPLIAHRRLWGLNLDHCPGPGMATQWHRHETNQNSTTRALRMDLTLNSQPHRRLVRTHHHLTRVTAYLSGWQDSEP